MYVCVLGAGCCVERHFAGNLHITGVQEWWWVGERGRLWKKAVMCDWLGPRNCHKTFSIICHLVHCSRTTQQHKDSESLIQGHLPDIPSHKYNMMKKSAAALSSSFPKCHYVPTHQSELNANSQVSAKCQ